MDLKRVIPESVWSKYEFYNYNHAAEILSQSFPQEWRELLNCLHQIQITMDDLISAGGNETNIPKKFDDFLYPLGWQEIKITGDLIIKKYLRKSSLRGRFSSEPYETSKIVNYIDGHNIDFVKNRVAFDLEWNSKDQTFDRDLMAMRTYYDCNIISAGVIVTRAEELNDIFKSVSGPNGKPLMTKYGASTTWIGKLIPRLDSRRNGGCPILAVGIKKACVTDWEEN